MNPIPKHLLQHSIVLRKRVQSPTISGHTFEDIQIDNVRVVFEQSTRMYIGMTAEPYNAMLRYDYVNSIPNDIEFSLEDLVVFNGREMQIAYIREEETEQPHGLKIWLR